MAKKIASKKSPAKKAAAKKAAVPAAPISASASAVAAVAAAPAAPQAEPTDEQLDAAYQKALKAYSNRSNVTGVDIGFRYKDGKRLTGFGVRIHVKEKIKAEALEADELLPESIDGVPVDVIQAVYKPHSALARPEPEVDPTPRTTRVDPIQPGISVSHPSVSSGTLGAIVYDKTTGHRGILSNWHVLVGDSDSQPGDPIVQPGKKYGGRTPQDRIGSLKRFILDVHGDAAVAILNGTRSVEPAQAESGVSPTEIRAVRRGEVLEKSGVKTGITRGIVDGTGRYTLDYAVGTRTIAGFKIVAEKDGNPDNLEISSGGDSGSLWYSPEDKMAVGLHFAGEDNLAPTEEHALACNLPAVLDELNLSLVPLGAVPPPPVEESETSAMSLVAGADSDRIVIETVARLARLLEAAYLKQSK